MFPRCSGTVGTTAAPIRCHSRGRWIQHAAALLPERVATGENVAIPPRCNESPGKPGLGGGSCLRRRQAPAATVSQPLSPTAGTSDASLFGPVWQLEGLSGGGVDGKLGVFQVSCHVNGKEKRDFFFWDKVFKLSLPPC